MANDAALVLMIALAGMQIGPRSALVRQIEASRRPRQRLVLADLPRETAVFGKSQ